MGHSGDDDPSDDPGDDSGLSTQYLGGLVAGALHQPDPVFPSTLLDIFSLSLCVCVCVFGRFGGMVCAVLFNQREDQ